MDREVAVKGEIGCGLVKRVRESIEAFNEESGLPITLVIDSSGGWTDALTELTGVIVSSRTPIYAMVDGEALSAAFMLLQHCGRRSSRPHSTFMFHAPRIPAEDVSRLTSFPCEEDIVEEDDPIYRELLEKLCCCTGKPGHVLDRWGREQKEFNAREALRLGFIDEIVERQS